MSLRLQELTLKSELIGYRLKSGYIAIDFGLDYFEDVVAYIMSSGRNIQLTHLMIGELHDDVYITKDEEFFPQLQCREAESLQDVYNFIDRHIKENNYIQHPIALARFLILRHNLKMIGVPVGYIKEFSVNPRLTRSWGRCRSNSKLADWENKQFTIELSEKFFISGLDSTEGIDSTIVHELLHTCPNCMNHKYQWKAWVIYVGTKLGIDTSRVSSAEDLGVDIDELIKSGYHACQCNDCGNIIVHKSLSKFIKHPEYYTCSCGGNFTRIA